MSKAEIEALKGEIEAKRKAKADGELENAGCAPTGKLLIKNRRVLKGHFAKIYAMHWAESPQCKNNLVSASQDGKLIVWNAFTTNKVHPGPCLRRPHPVKAVTDLTGCIGAICAAVVDGGERPPDEVARSVGLAGRRTWGGRRGPGFG